MDVAPMLVLDDQGEGMSIEDASTALLYLAEQEQAQADAEIDRARAQRRAGRAEAFAEAARMLAGVTASDRLRSGDEVSE